MVHVKGNAAFGEKCDYFFQLIIRNKNMNSFGRLCKPSRRSRLLPILVEVVQLESRQKLQGGSETLVGKVIYQSIQ